MIVVYNKCLCWQTHVFPARLLSAAFLTSEQTLLDRHSDLFRDATKC